MFSDMIRAACVAVGAFALTAVVPNAAAQDANRDVVVARTDVHDLVDRLAKRSGDFKEEFDHAVEHSMMDGSRIEDRAKHRADDLHDSAKKLRDVFGDKKDKNDPAVRDQADKTLAAAADINRLMADHRFTDKLQRDWGLLRSDLNALAAVYDLSPLQ